MARVNNKFLVTDIKTTDTRGLKVTLNPVYVGEPEFTVGIALADNSERNIEIYVPSGSTSSTFFVVGNKYYMDFTAV